MNTSAQASLEYLMTYGWALIMIATVIGVLVFVVGTPSEEVTFTSSDPTRLLLKGYGIDDSGNASVILQNVTGGDIKITSVGFLGDLSKSATTTVNGSVLTADTFPIDIPAGAEIRLEGLSSSNNAANSEIKISYTDFANFDRVATTTSGEGGPAGLVAKYDLDGDGYDSSGNDLSGEISGSVTPSTDCPSGSCIYFDGSGRFNLPDSTALLSNYGCTNFITIANKSYCTDGQSTIVAWINVPNPNQFNRITEGLGGFHYFSGGSTSAAWLVTMVKRSDTGGNDWPGSVQTINANEWTHVAFVLIGGEGYKFYINGELVKDESRSILALFNYKESPTEYVTIGAYNSVLYIDELAIYGSELSSSQICNDCKRFASKVNVTCTC